jgi:hypothetical protein
MVEVSSTCLFTFITKFSPLNGVYRVRAETSFADAVASNTDFITYLYTPAGLGQADFNTDYPSYLNDKVLVLESVSTPLTVYYVPESIFQTIPDPTVREFVPLMATMNLGVHQNTQRIYPLLDQLKDLIQASLGITDPLLVMTNTQNKVYLTDTQYQTLEATRQASIHALIPLSLQLKQAQDDNAVLAAKINAYEALIKQLSS